MLGEVGRAQGEQPSQVADSLGVRCDAMRCDAWYHTGEGESECSAPAGYAQSSTYRVHTEYIQSADTVHIRCDRSVHRQVGLTVLDSASQSVLPEYQFVVAHRCAFQQRDDAPDNPSVHPCGREATGKQPMAISLNAAIGSYVTEPLASCCCCCCNDVMFAEQVHVR